MNAVQPAPAVVRFGVFELDVASGVLRKAGARLNLQTQPLQVLTALLERPGAIVTREELRQRLWADDTFVDFERGLNAAVKRLRDTLGDSADTPRFIETMPRRGYRFIAPVEIPGAAPAAVIASTPVPAPRRSWRAGVVLAAALAVVAVGAVWILPRFRAPDTPMRVVPLTTMNGFEAGGISPDGHEAVFEWGGERGDNQDIYVKLVGSSDTRQLTTDPARDIAPVWSHDGRQIVYIRIVTPPTEARIRVVSRLGGGDRQVSEFPVRVPAGWSPDDRYLIAGRAAPPGETNPDNGIYLIRLQDGSPRALTHPTPPQIDMMASFSPDGRRLAYVSCTDPSTLVCHVNVLDVDETLTATAPPHRLAAQTVSGWIAGLSWTPDGRALVYGRSELGFTYLWRIAADGRTPPSRIDIAGNGAMLPSISGDRLSFTSFITDVDMYRVEQGRPPEAVARSSAFDGNISLAPDGRRFAYCSQRSGDSVEIWVATLDGSEARLLTRGGNRHNCSPAWSPDGRRIAYDSQSADGSWHVWTVDPEGGMRRQITTDPGDQNLPTWSHDSAWLYFTWHQKSERNFWTRDLWRVRHDTGEREQLTKSGDVLMGRESADKSTLLLQSSPAGGPLRSQPIGGGPFRTLASCAWGMSLSATKAGVYYIPCSGNPAGGADLRLITPAGVDQRVMTLDRYSFSPTPGTFAILPDGHTILYEREVHSTGDLMMIEHFK